MNTQAQLAAEIAQKWPVTPAYRVTQPGKPELTQRILWRLYQAYLGHRALGES